MASHYPFQPPGCWEKGQARVGFPGTGCVYKALPRCGMGRKQENMESRVRQYLPTHAQVQPSSSAILSLQHDVSTL